MNALIKKEIRLLFPAFVIALTVAILPAAIIPRDPTNPGMVHGWLFCFGILMLGVSSFGREISLKTLPFMLTQPSPRERIWWTKIVLLAAAVAVVFVAWVLSGGFAASVPLTIEEQSEFPVVSAIMVIVLVTGGLWTTLLLRQVAAAFWLTALIPMGLAGVISSATANDKLVFAGLGLYALAGVWLARWLFLHAQDTSWSGGVLTFGRRTAVETSTPRARRPWAALLWKELQLQQATLAGMACLLVLHLGSAALRKFGHTLSHNVTTILEAVAFLWFIMPVLVGCQCVADERKLGTIDSLLCLPIARRTQWFIKLSLALLIGGLVSAISFTMIERWVDPGGISGGIGLSLVFVCLAVFGFYASSLTNGILQSLVAVGATLGGLWLALIILINGSGSASHVGVLLVWLILPVEIPAAIWLSYRNFGHPRETSRLWRRNAFGLAVALAFCFAATVLIYWRAWEWLTPQEPPHGPARLSLQNPPQLMSGSTPGWPSGPGLAAVFPDGRLWIDRLGYAPRSRFRALDFIAAGKWVSLDADNFQPGSNWISAAPTTSNTLALRSDGSLWASDKPESLRPLDHPIEASTAPVSNLQYERELDWRAAPLVQSGSETNWKTFITAREGEVLLLKRDGTLWKSDGLRDSVPHRVGTNSDWDRILEFTFGNPALLWQTNGSAWGLFKHERNAGQEVLKDTFLERVPALDNLHWRSYASSVALRDDGTLWSWRSWQNQAPRGGKLSTNNAPLGGRGKAPVQIGTDSDWSSISYGNNLLACKTNGTLWRLRWPAREGLPDWGITRVGTHSDWVAVGAVDGDSVSLAADGSLWHWPSPETWYPRGEHNFTAFVLGPSRKPDLIENILSPQ